MLRRTQIFVIIFFIFSVSVWGGYKIFVRENTDKTSPVISMDEDSITVSVEGGDEAILEGVTARDEKDGDLSDQIFIENRSDFVSKGSFTVTLAVADSDNHVTKATRNVTYSDYHSPKYELSRPFRFQTTKESQEDLNIAEGLSARDVIDGDITNKIKISEDYTINTFSPDEYPMEFVLSNSMGDVVKLPVTVTIYSATEENALPQIKLKHYLVNTDVGKPIDLESMVEEVNYRGYVYHQAEDGKFYSQEYDVNGLPIMFDSSQLHISGDADYNTPGVYEVSYTYTDKMDSVSNSVRLIIVVNE